MLSVHSFVFRDMASPPNSICLAGLREFPFPPCLFLCTLHANFLLLSLTLSYSLSLSLLTLSFVFHSPAVAFKKIRRWHGCLSISSPRNKLIKFGPVFSFPLSKLLSLSNPVHFNFSWYFTPIRFIAPHGQILVNDHNACHLFFL